LASKAVEFGEKTQNTAIRPTPFMSFKVYRGR